MSFTKFPFSKQILHNIKREGFKQPTPIQDQAIEPILEGKDLLGLAHTGTGKTAAFILPIIQNLSGSEKRGKPRALILSPTRELAEQTGNCSKSFAQKTGLHTAVIYGGASKQGQLSKLRRGVDIVVACPGRLLDLSNSSQIDLSKVEIFVLDEADQMFDQGFLPDVKKILQRLPKNTQNLVFSATMPPEVQKICASLLSNPVKVALNHTSPIETISHTLLKVDSSTKRTVLQSLLKDNEMKSAIVFTRTKHKAKSLALKLSKSGFKVTSLQGNLSQNQRHFALDGFKRGKFNILVATDIAARGIDIASISHVINFDMPETLEAYTHRTGRTGRANKLGKAVTLATPEDKKMVGILKKNFADKLCIDESYTRQLSPAVPPAQVKSKSYRKSVIADKSNENRPPKKGKRSSKRNRAATYYLGR